MKEKIGMEKLVELLREYNMSNQSPYILGDADYYVDGGLYAPQIISKSRGFIKRLVENDKIDFRKLSYKNIYMSDYGSSDDIFLAYNKGEQGIIYTVDYYESLLMLLSISDTPIEDLISYLHE